MGVIGALSSGSIFVAAGDSYLSRFFTKFVEISAAGVATAVSGYVLAHFTGYLNTPPAAALQSPAALQVPATRPVPAVPVPVAPAPVASAPTASPAAAPIARATVTTAPQPDAKSAPLRKSLPADKPADTANAADGKVRDVTDTKPRSPESIEAEVRAALAKVDAAHPGKPDSKTDAKPDTKAETKADTTPRRADNPAEIAARTPPTDSKPRPVDSSTGTIATTTRPDAPPRAADLAPQQPLSQPAQQQLAPQPLSQPGPQAPMQIAPPTATVEIKSMPVTGVDSASQPAPQTGAQAQSNDGGLFSAFRRLPEKLRDDKPLPSDQAPRPPADVGQ
jgi:hypothetical protein